VLGLRLLLNGLDRSRRVGQAEGIKNQPKWTQNTAAASAIQRFQLFKCAAVMHLTHTARLIPLITPLRFVVHVTCSRHPSFTRAFDEKDDGGGDLRLAMMMTPQVMAVLVAIAIHAASMTSMTIVEMFI
jgi:hypothetical protein